MAGSHAPRTSAKLDASPGAATLAPVPAGQPRTAVRLYVLVAAIAALGVLAAGLARAVPPSGGNALLALAFVAAIALAGLVPFPIGAQTLLLPSASVQVAAVLLFPPGVAMLIAGAGALLADGLQVRRLLAARGWDAAEVVRRGIWLEALFGAAHPVLEAAAGAAVLRAAGWTLADLQLERPGGALVALAAGGAMWALNTLLVAPAVALETREDPRRVLRRLLMPGGRAEAAADLGQVGLGVVVAGVVAAGGALPALLLLPSGAAYFALAHRTRVGRETEAALARRAYHDPLTGLPNRALFADRLTGALGPAGEHAGPVAVLYVDLDGFKDVNDAHGHPTGDRLLVAVAGRVAACVRPADTVARLGGDEFAVLLWGLRDGREAERVAGRIVAALDAPFVLDGAEVRVGASVGIAAGASGAADADELQRQADLALYEAKRRGKAGWVRFRSDQAQPGVGAPEAAG